MGRFFRLFVVFFVVSVHCFSQSQSGLLVLAVILSNPIPAPTNNPEFLEGKQFNSSYNYNLQIGYRFRFENPRHDRIFFDVDPLIKLQTFKNVSFSPGTSADYTSVTAEARDINFQLAVSPSVNYLFFKRVYLGMGVEPTWNIVTEGKHFDIPVFGRIGYSLKGKMELAVTYRHGFLNVIDDSKYNKGRISDLSVGIFIPFYIK